ncbi:hypothetical protein PV10_05770 [Exophiala mesophila]|uniref:Uncharacterized protein n=1 Tax=Exophiala mesophila TaxID=212818 RepID=A0A0D1XSU0_EXOME|nr:uncharacterized protein PV10_05770 [Exophiala mesophila]KIV91206.1 hypothetical protein PV10_05770 [Exophiala mesophila]
MTHRGPSSAFESETFGQDASFRLEQPVGALSISPSGRDVVLASKEGLHIIDLDSPYSPPRYLAHRTPWEVADVQWSPFAARDHWIISTSNQKALVWNLRARSWQDSIEYVLHGHTRAITDINFSAHNPDVLATCAVDSFVHCWDLRTPSRPVNSFSDWFAGATQVKWCRQNEHVVASSHDKFLHTWDVRKGAHPLKTIQAHGTKIYGIDWNRHQPNKILTCSLDRTIKFWDLDKADDQPERVIETPFPVWRARHTPFGWGLVAMPQRGNSNLHLYDRRAVHGVYESGPVRPVTTFPGHDGQVKEFLWRSRGDINNDIDDREFQLVTWGTDRELRLHAVNPEVYLDIGYEKGVSKVQRLHNTRKGATYRTFRDEPKDEDSPIEPPRGEFLPRHSMVQFRARTSTNVGMNKNPVTQFRGWVAGGRQNQPSGMHGRGHNRQTADPIAWLKNVKIFSWDPDAIAEEIRQVGEKFKNVEFEFLDIAHRKAIMSIHAPWGENQTPVYLKVEMRFPKLYPRDANAVLSLQKTASIDEASHKHISTELQTISETYASRRRGCLEAVMRYLLREQNLEQIVAWVLGESITDSKILEPAAIAVDDSSSDEDDQIEAADKRLDASANLRVPLAKGCGALWSDTGKLVCFFPSKPKEPVSFLSTLGVKDLEESESSRLFEGFGRLNTSSPARKMASGTRTADDETSSDTSESSWTSSSSSSASFETEHNAQGGSSLPIVVSGLHQRSRSPDRSNQSTTGGQKLNEAPQTSSVSLHTFDDLIPSKRELAEDYRIVGNGGEVCDHNAKVAAAASLDDLASVWTLLGLILDDSVPLEVFAEVNHNAINDITLIAKMANPNSNKYKGPMASELRGRTRWGNHPLGSPYLIPALFDHFERLGDIQMLAMMSCVLTSMIEADGISRDPWKGQTVNGTNDNLARFDYFPSKAVAKAFFRPEPPPVGFTLVDQSVLLPQSGSQLAGHRQLMTGQPRSQTAQRHALARHESQLSSRAHSFMGDDLSEPRTTHSTTMSMSTSPEGNRANHRSTASIAYSTARASLSALTQSYSNSPPSQNSASAIASSIKKYSPSSSLAPNWVAHGLFGSQSTGRHSRSYLIGGEAGSQDSRDARTRTSMSSVSLRNEVPRSDAGRRSLWSIAPSEVSDQTQKKPPTKRKRIKTILYNQDKFDLDGYPHSGFSDPELDERCRTYRACYAHLLDVWQLHVPRAEILKADGIRMDDRFVSQQRLGSLAATTAGVQSHHALPAQGRMKTLGSALRFRGLGLEIRQCCHRCGQVLAAIEKNGIPFGWHCVQDECSEATRRLSKHIACVICNNAVKGLSVPCLQCGHMTCFECAQEWFGPELTRGRGPDSRRSTEETRPNTPTESVRFNDSLEPINDAYEGQTCPTGCGCPCSTLSVVKAPFPHTHDDQDDVQVHSLIRRYSNSNSTIGRTPSVFSGNQSVVDHGVGAGHIESHGGSDAAFAAFLAISQNHPRQRSVTNHSSNGTNTPSTAGNSTRASRSKAPSMSHYNTVPSRPILEAEEMVIGPDDSEGFGLPHIGYNEPESDEMKLNPWAGSKIATLGRGIGAGLSRGLSSKGSSTTIRKGK